MTKELKSFLEQRTKGLPPGVGPGAASHVRLLEELALRDCLTGLANRHILEFELEQRLATLRRPVRRRAPRPRPLQGGQGSLRTPGRRPAPAGGRLFSAELSEGGRSPRPLGRGGVPRDRHVCGSRRPCGPRRTGLPPNRGDDRRRRPCPAPHHVLDRRHGVLRDRRPPQSRRTGRSPPLRKQDPGQELRHVRIVDGHEESASHAQERRMGEAGLEPAAFRM